MTEDAVNPVNPSSVGGLLAEELTMSPFTTLPSFLEMMMIEETAASGRLALSSSLQAVVNRAAAIATVSSDGGNILVKLRVQFARIVENVGRNYSPEIRLIAAYLIESKCLKSNACATLSESMFGARRAKLGGVQMNKEGKSSRKVLQLSDADKTRLALLVSLGPYVKERLDMLFRRLHGEQTLNQANSIEPLDRWTKVRMKIRSLFVMVYPFLHMTHEGTMLAYEWSYLVGRSLFFSPSSHLLGLIVRRVTAADFSSSKNSLPPAKTSSFEASQLRESIVRRLRLAFVTAVSGGLVLGWISHLRHEMRRHRRQQLLRDGSRQQLHSFSIPPPQSPPLQMQAADRIRPLPDDQALCPICRQPRINPAASTSGHVFCYRCLVLYVRQHGTCPLTGRECPEFRILRIYEPRHDDSSSI